MGACKTKELSGLFPYKGEAVCVGKSTLKSIIGP